MSKHATIDEIAIACGVSSMTVSRVLRHTGRVNEETRKKVLTAAEKLQYLPSTNQGRPRNQPSQPSPVAQIIIGSLEDMPPLYHLRLLVAVERQFSRKGFDCLVHFTDGEYAAFSRMLESIRRTVGEVVVAIGNFPNEHLCSLACVQPGLILLDSEAPGTLGNHCRSISFDNTRAAALAVRHLAQDAGRRDILLLTGPRTYPFAREMEAGYCAALEENGLAYRPELLVRCDFSQNDAAWQLEQVLDQGVAFDAVFTNDEMAAAVYRVLAAHGLLIPNDISVCGCDNIPSGEQLHPELTTVSLPFDQLAEQAAELAVSDVLCRPYSLRLMPELLVRHSTVK
ncbi:MAG: LacI family DNA-binding transcriptional regulator [Victivallales bacterium]|nr:LacI family DNA-binding transcriptional regulator [Victivallales bacterium]